MEILHAANITFGPDTLRSQETALQREWLVTNGLGGYASATLATANTRRYHGLLVAALNPPVGRAVLLSKLEETLEIRDARGSTTTAALSTNAYPGVLYPQGYAFLQTWRAYPCPTWQWDIATSEACIEKQVWMAHGQNTVYIAYRLTAAPPDSTATLSLAPLLAWRDYHSEMAACDTRPPAVWSPPNAAPLNPGSSLSPADSAEAPGTLRVALPPIARVTSAPTILRLRLLEALLETNPPGDADAPVPPEQGFVPFPQATFAPQSNWYYRFQHPREQERGLGFQEDLYSPGIFSVSLAVGQTLVVMATTEEAAQDAPVAAWNAFVRRQSDLLTRALSGSQNHADRHAAANKLAPASTAARISRESSETQEPQAVMGALVAGRSSESPASSESLLSSASSEQTFAQQLTLAADAFIVYAPEKKVRTTVIAGYHWFEDWGRDTMIALPGLCSATGRPEMTREILLSFANYVDQGMLPNRFPDVGETPEYNTVDATLWYFVATYHYVMATGDTNVLSDKMWNVLTEIVDWHRRGTRYHIHVDAKDHLLHAGQPGVQLTWMDAKVGDWVVTPRIGKPVEINALWINALYIMAHFAGLLRDASDVEYTRLAQEAQASFSARFARPDGQGLYDVLDPPNQQPDASVRPNQIFALSLPFAVVEPASPVAAAIIKVVKEQLLTPGGLRTLSPQDPAYQSRYQGDQLHRDGAYHQGTAWPWLLGPFAEAYMKVTGDRAGAQAILLPLQSQLAVYGVGSLAEIYDGGASNPADEADHSNSPVKDTEPQRPNGCIAQAWSIAETLRVWKLLAE